MKETSLKVQPFRTYLEPNPSKYQLKSKQWGVIFSQHVLTKLCFSQRQGTIHTSLHENGSFFSPGGQGRGLGPLGPSAAVFSHTAPVESCGPKWQRRWVWRAATESLPKQSMYGVFTYIYHLKPPKYR